ncbi:bifunctional DNA primase/polymerase [Caldicellulosiruptor acetigenus]|uniref:bifunctional DNA primase/polymerase n=1 Tax=Caldicellulosiruptor acetigenus TaxID=301953 RepID=UPI00041AFEC0|nr:bifunctional DNA primase/polymerase [Caldicellulosiruptor acetigenus]WAM35594.1 bifunctional DNA primase/polymerase [Caldicellulosiruptor acetigenus]
MSNENQNLKMLRAAIAYVERLNWAVLPLHSIVDGQCTCGKRDCPNAGKHPLGELVPNGVKDATKDKKKVKEWWLKRPWANIGIATGKISGFFVLDVDGEIGKEELRTLEVEHDKLPDTVEQLTGSGGKHILFKYPSDVVVPNKVGFIPKVDIRSDGGYIVVAPSIHKSGNQYMWEASSHPLEVEIAEPPKWLIDMIVEKPLTDVKRPPEWWRKLAQGVPEGYRNMSAASLMGLLLRKRINPVLATMLVLAWNREYNKPPMDDKEVLRVCESIAKREMQRLQGGMNQ